MIKFDYHTHSSFSSDSATKMKDMADAAFKLGFSGIAITDHFDPDYANPSEIFDLDEFDYNKCISELQKNYGPEFKLIRGLEVGIQKHVVSECLRAVLAYPYDFVIGSFHCAEKKELYGGDFFKDRSLKDSYISFYEYVHECLKIYKDYSVVGHFNILERYSSDVPDPSCYMDIVEETFKMIISDGKGIEFNTSSFRYGMGDNFTPSYDMLKLYRDLGGEIITVGSDAHAPQDIGDHFEFVRDLLLKIGFRYITTFDKMLPHMVLI